VLLLYVLLRLEPNNALKLSLEQFNNAIIFLIFNDNPNIKVFIRVELENCIESRKLIIGNLALILEIQNALLEGS